MKIGLSYGAELECPCCGGPSLHQERVQVFWRHDENSSENVRTVTSTDTYTSEYTRGKNPSPRRDGILITFDCENCDGMPELAIIQHKGGTYFKWASARQEFKDA